MTKRMHFPFFELSASLSNRREHFGLALTIPDYLYDNLIIFYDPQNIKNYKDYIRSVCNLLGVDKTNPDFEREIDEMVEMELNITNAYENYYYVDYDPDYQMNMTLKRLRLDNLINQIPEVSLLISFLLLYNT